MGTLEKARMLDLQTVVDERGTLNVAESGKNIPFEIRRVFYMHHVSADRGGHAHANTEQVIIPVAGSFTIELSDGEGKRVFELTDPTKGLYRPPMTFIELKNFSPEAVCLVLTSTLYQDDRRLEGMDAFRRELENPS